MENENQLINLLERIEANQQQLLQGQHQALELQKQQFEMARTQFDRAEKLHERAEKIQATSASIMSNARRSLMVILPIVVVLIAYLSWLIFR